MHFSDFKSPSPPPRLVRLVLCALLPACLQEVVASGVSLSARRPVARQAAPSSQSGSSPYLLVCLPPPLRFAETVEAADPVAPLPFVSGPPHPAGIIEEIAATNQEAAVAVQPPPPSNAPPPAHGAEVAGSADPAAAPPPRETVSILPDQTPRQIRSEDVLFYFQYPASAPANNLPPPSSATYHQQ